MKGWASFELFTTLVNWSLETWLAFPLVEAIILRAKEIPLEILRQAKTTKNEEIIPFTVTYNLNNPDVFSIIN